MKYYITIISLFISFSLKAQNTIDFFHIVERDGLNVLCISLDGFKNNKTPIIEIEKKYVKNKKIITSKDSIVVKNQKLDNFKIKLLDLDRAIFSNSVNNCLDGKNLEITYGNIYKGITISYDINCYEALSEFKVFLKNLLKEIDINL